jgi:hypothetical protein
VASRSRAAALAALLAVVLVASACASSEGSVPIKVSVSGAPHIVACSGVNEQRLWADIDAAHDGPGTLEGRTITGVDQAGFAVRFTPPACDAEIEAPWIVALANRLAADPEREQEILDLAGSAP